MYPYLFYSLCYDQYNHYKKSKINDVTISYTIFSKDGTKEQYTLKHTGNDIDNFHIACKMFEDILRNINFLDIKKLDRDVVCYNFFDNTYLVLSELETDNHYTVSCCGSMVLGDLIVEDGQYTMKVNLNTVRTPDYSTTRTERKLQVKVRYHTCIQSNESSKLFIVEPFLVNVFPKEHESDIIMKYLSYRVITNWLRHRVQTFTLKLPINVTFPVVPIGSIDEVRAPLSVSIELTNELKTAYSKHLNDGVYIPLTKKTLCVLDVEKYRHTSTYTKSMTLAIDNYIDIKISHEDHMKSLRSQKVIELIYDVENITLMLITDILIKSEVLVTTDDWSIDTMLSNTVMSVGLLDLCKTWYMNYMKIVK